MIQFIAGLIVAVFFCVIVAVAYVAGLNDKIKPLRTLARTEDDEKEVQEAQKRMKDFERLMSYTEKQALMRAGE